MSFNQFNTTPAPNRNAATNRAHNPNNDVVLSDPPTDSIQTIQWSPTSNILACSAWDCTVRAYNIDSNTGSTCKVAEYKNDAPALDVCWTNDGNHILSAGCDKLIKIYNPNQSMSQVIGYHEKPIRKIAFCADNGAPSQSVISGGWDKELRYWDIKQTVAYSSNRNQNGNHDNYKSQLKPIGNVKLSERVYAMDFQYPILCVALADKKVLIFDVRNPSKPMKEMVTLLKHQLRCVSIFPDKQGFAVGSVEGRCAIHYIQENQQNNKKSFAFKCHRKKQNVFAVNSLRFHNGFGTFASAGGDGSIYFWDKDQKQKLHTFPDMKLPVTDVGFNSNGQLFAYAISYDWSKGIEHFQPKEQKPEIFVHKLELDEIRPKTNN